MRGSSTWSRRAGCLVPSCRRRSRLSGNALGRQLSDSSSRIRTSSQQRAREFQPSDGLFPCDRREVFQEALKRIVGGQIINKVFERDSGACEDRGSPQNFGVTPNDRFQGGCGH